MKMTDIKEKNLASMAHARVEEFSEPPLDLLFLGAAAQVTRKPGFAGSQNRSNLSRKAHLEKSTKPSLRQPGLTAANVAETWQRLVISDSSG